MALPEAVRRRFDAALKAPTRKSAQRAVHHGAQLELLFSKKQKEWFQKLEGGIDQDRTGVLFARG